MKLRYVELPPDRIFNRLAPENATAVGAFGKRYKDRWWDSDVVKLRRKFAAEWTLAYDNITGHFTSLEQSIRAEGIKYPVSVVSGPFRGKLFKAARKIGPFHPPHAHQNPNELIFTQPFGGSRVTMAQKLKLETVPCVIHDYSNLFPSAPEVTRANYQQWFNDDYIFRGEPPHLVCRRGCHIKDQQYKDFTTQVRRAQRKATKIAKKKLGLD